MKLKLVKSKKGKLAQPLNANFIEIKKEEKINDDHMDSKKMITEEQNIPKIHLHMRVCDCDFDTEQILISHFKWIDKRRKLIKYNAIVREQEAVYAAQQIGKDKNFLFVLNRIMLNANGIQKLELLIPDMIIFDTNAPKYIVHPTIVNSSLPFQLIQENSVRLTKVKSTKTLQHSKTGISKALLSNKPSTYTIKLNHKELSQDVFQANSQIKNFFNTQKEKCQQRFKKEEKLQLQVQEQLLELTTVKDKFPFLLIFQQRRPSKLQLFKQKLQKSQDGQSKSTIKSFKDLQTEQKTPNESIKSSPKVKPSKRGKSQGKLGLKLTKRQKKMIEAQKRLERMKNTEILACVKYIGGKRRISIIIFVGDKQNYTEPQLNDKMYDKNRSLWFKKISYIQGKYQIQKDQKKFQIHFNLDKYLDSDMYYRAYKYLINVMSGVPEASKDYISHSQEQQYENVLYHSGVKNYALYKALKIHLFIRIKFQQSIIKMNLTFVDYASKNQAWLIDITNLRYDKIEKLFDDYLNEEEFIAAERFFTSKKIYFIQELRRMREEEEKQFQQRINTQYKIKHYKYLPGQKDPFQVKKKEMWYEKFAKKQKFKEQTKFEKEQLIRQFKEKIDGRVMAKIMTDVTKQSTAGLSEIKKILLQKFKHQTQKPELSVFFQSPEIKLRNGYIMEYQNTRQKEMQKTHEKILSRLERYKVLPNVKRLQTDPSDPYQLKPQKNKFVFTRIGTHRQIPRRIYSRTDRTFYNKTQSTRNQQMDKFNKNKRQTSYNSCATTTYKLNQTARNQRTRQKALFKEQSYNRNWKKRWNQNIIRHDDYIQKRLRSTIKDLHHKQKQARSLKGLNMFKY